MAERDAPAVVARGGAGIQALRPSRTRLTTGLAALAAAAGVGAYASVSGGALAGLAAGLAAVALALLGLSLVLRFRGGIPWVVVLGAASYLASRQGRSGVDVWSAGVGALLLASAEFATWSIDDDTRIVSERRLVVRRALVLAGLLAGGAVVDVLLLAAATAASAAGVLIVAAGVAASVGAVGVALRLLRA